MGKRKERKTRKKYLWYYLPVVSNYILWLSISKPQTGNIDLKLSIRIQRIDIFPKKKDKKEKRGN